MPRAAQSELKRGPVAALLLLFGLILGSTNAASQVESAGPFSGLAQTRPGKAVVALRSASHDLTAEDGDRLDGPSLLPSSFEVVSRTELHPASHALRLASATPPQPLGLAYQARAPPAA